MPLPNSIGITKHSWGQGECHLQTNPSPAIRVMETGQWEEGWREPRGSETSRRGVAMKRDPLPLLMPQVSTSARSPTKDFAKASSSEAEEKSIL